MNGLEARLEAERGQLPLWLPVALGGGISAWFLLPDPIAWWGFGGLMAALPWLRSHGVGAGGHRACWQRGQSPHWSGAR